SLKILAVTLPEVSPTTRRASSTQRRGLMNCSEQISVAQRRTVALPLHARCRDVAPKDLPSARLLWNRKNCSCECHRATDVSKKLRTEPGAKCGVGQLVTVAEKRCGSLRARVMKA